MTPKRFSGFVQLCRDGVITRTELLVNFLQGIADNADHIAAFFAELPQDLLRDLEDFMQSPEEEWIEDATAPGFLGLGSTKPGDVPTDDPLNLRREAHARSLYLLIRGFLARNRGHIVSAPALNFMWPTDRITLPCPECGNQLLSSFAKHCVSCGVDWSRP